MGSCPFITCLSLPQISMASCTTSPTPTGIKLKWWLASPWSSTRSCRSMELTRWGAETNLGCGVGKKPTYYYFSVVLGLKPQWHCICIFLWESKQTEFVISACTHPEAPWGPCCHVRKKKTATEAHVVAGSESVWGSALTVSCRSCIWMTWLLSSLVSVALWEVKYFSSVTSPYCEKSLALF